MAKYLGYLDNCADLDFGGDLAAEETLDSILAGYGVGKGDRLATMGRDGSVEGDTLDNWVEQ